VPGTIVAPQGPLTFGWDPIFKPDGFDKTYSQLEKSVKNSISHRGRSLALLKSFLSEKGLHQKSD
jgi:inosine triphosphate pyrophosphatase